MLKKTIYFPILFALILCLGIFIGTRLNHYALKRSFFSSNVAPFNKLSEVVNYINQEYVDTVNNKKLAEASIEAMLQSLDPHSSYIPAEELQAVNEPLEGNFDGIGVEFHIQSDTIMVVSPISGGPSELLGIQPGDRIVKIEGKNVAGVKINNNDVMLKLRGPGGTKVKITVFRKSQQKMIDYTITRGKIPIYSIEASYMIDDKTGYIKLSRFAATTFKEYSDAFANLKAEGLQSLILDMRGNPGGFLTAAIQIADEFLDNKKLIVYTQGRSRPKSSYYASSSGGFEKGKLIVLIDEGSASASEIVSGAVQDWDRATIIGRRSFGKGLVQEQSLFPDGSALRLTVARYYTPTGRSIQKSYKGGVEEYNNELYLRMKKGEFESVDSIKFVDSLSFKTPGGRTVYGGGGIMPDIFVPLDTVATSPYFSNIINKGLITQFTFDYVDRNRAMLKSFKSFKEYNKAFQVNDNIMNEFVLYAESRGVLKNVKGILKSGSIIKTQIKANIARQLWKNQGFYPVIQEIDNTLKKAIEVANAQGVEPSGK
jgi:carboxyl-terminal processing protease